MVLPLLLVGAILSASFLSVSSTNANAYMSYQNGIYCSASTSMQTPSTVSDLQAIVLNAITTNQTVKAIGSRHSLTDCICTSGIPISMHNINYAMVNEDGTATFGAGMELVDAMQFLEANNLSLIHVPAFGGITIGGAIGTGAHGSSLLHPPSLSDQIVKLTIIDGLGNVRVISEVADVNAFRVHLGLLGIVVDVTLRTVPLFKMRVENVVEPESILFDGTAVSWAQQYDWFQLWWFPSYGEVVVSKGNYTDVTTPGNASTNLIPNEDPATIASANSAFELLQASRNLIGEQGLEKYTELSLYSTIAGKPPIFTEDGITLSNPAVGYGWRLQSDKCTECTWENGDGTSILPEESSIAFDLAQFSSVMTMMKTTISANPIAMYMIGAFVRFSKPSNALMAISSGRSTFTVEWVTPKRLDPYKTSKDGIWTYQALLQTMVTNYGGRPHWGKNGLHYSAPSIVQSAFPSRSTFISAMNKYDPNGVFLNKFGRRILGISTASDMDPQVTRCALQDYCICQSPSDCAPGQTCTALNGFMVCKDVLPSLPVHL